MNKQERPIPQYRFYYDSDSDYDTEPEEDEEYNNRPDVNDKKKLTKKQIQTSILTMFDSDED